jgi:23S rRNA (cytidine1920-2'-O)/16S rRNA (cytidine1409-2'-O)-methyltransferase
LSVEGAIGHYNNRPVLKSRSVNKVRLDKLLVERGFFPSGEKARRAVMAGEIRVDDRPADKPGKAVKSDCRLAVLSRYQYVGRGGEKLAAALRTFGISVSKKKCLDIGASTGGFTDCLLQAGAAAVVAVDVGHGQMAQRVREDPRVTLLDRTNARYLKRRDLPYEPELATIDVSFISLDKIIPAVVEIIGHGAELVALIKPQFEAGREDVGRGGVVRDVRVHTSVIWNVCEMCEANGLMVRGLTESPLRGPAGNREFFIYVIKERTGDNSRYPGKGV